MIDPFPLPIPALYAGFNALIIAALIIVVIRARWRLRIPLGDHGEQAMIRLMRGHANPAGTMPLAQILLALIERLEGPVAAYFPRARIAAPAAAGGRAWPRRGS